MSAQAIEKIYNRVSKWCVDTRPLWEGACFVNRSGRIYFIVQPIGDIPNSELEHSLKLLAEEIGSDDDCKVLEFEAFSCVGPPEKYDNWVPGGEGMK